MKFNVLALTGFLALAVAQAPPAPPAPPKAPGPPAPKPNADGPSVPKAPGGPGGGKGNFGKLVKCAKDCFPQVFATAEKGGCQSLFPKKDAGAGPGTSGAAPPPPSPGKAKVNIIARQAPGPKGGKGKGGAPGGGKGKGAPQITDEQRAKFKEAGAKAKEWATCACKTQAPTEFFACATSKCTGENADALSTLTTVLNSGCENIQGYKPFAAPASPGGPVAARMMTT